MREGVSGYIAKHKFCSFGGKFGANGINIGLIKHFDHDYKIPKIEGIITTMNRNFNIEKGSTAHNSHMYRLKIANFDTYTKCKDVILSLVEKSIDIAENHWEKRLKVENGAKRIIAKDIFIENNIEEYSKLALMYLDPDYKYDVGN